MNTAVVGAIAAGVVRRQRLIVEAFRNAGAVVPERAASTDTLGIHEGQAFRILRRQGQLREVARGRFYLDEASWSALVERRRRVAQTMLGLLALVALGFLLFALSWRA